MKRSQEPSLRGRKILNDGIGKQMMAGSVESSLRQTNVQYIYILLQVDEIQWYAQNLSISSDSFGAWLQL